MGAIADWISPQATLALGAFISIAVGVLYVKRKE